jgi:RimJ/RimL family protein N-acetyltransferase
MTSWPAPFTVSGDFVSATPLTMDYHDDLVEAAADGELHRLWYTSVPAPDRVAAEIERRMALATMLPFAIIDKASGKAVGMTTYMNIDAPNRRLEIGSTWYRKSVQRSQLNTECKLLLLGYAFDTLDCIAVEFRTHFLNQQSRRAIERLGAKLDGILRCHSILPNGTIRDTAVYSITAAEWPMVKANLVWMMEKPRA